MSPRFFSCLCKTMFCVLLFVIGCGGNSNNDTSKTASGKVVQSYVANATVFVDKNNNQSLDKDEPWTTTDSQGNFELTIPDDTSGVLMSINGTVSSTSLPALPCWAPKTANNITPLTTLVALNPELKEKIGDGWDTDLASSTGVSGKLLQLALVIENFQSGLKQMGVTANSDQFALLTVLSKNLSQADLSSDQELLNAVNATLAGQFGQSIPAILDGVQTILSTIDEQQTQVESQIIAQIGTVIYNLPAVAFDPTQELIPAPNDLIWENSGGLVTLNATATSDSATAALYEAVNKLQLKGLSPNALIGIPLNSNQTLDETSLKQAVQVVDLTSLVGILYQTLSALGNTPEEATSEAVMAQLASLDDTQWSTLISLVQAYSDLYLVSDLEILQDDNYIKIFPDSPLKAGNNYLVLLKDNILLSDGSNYLQSSPLFDLLKSDQELTGNLAELEPLRQAYAPIFTYYLHTLGLDKDDVLELFTLTTATKTLNLTDFGYISAALDNGMDLDSFLSVQGLSLNGLELNNTSAEYTSLDELLTSLEPYMQVDSQNKTFVSFDISKLPDVEGISVPFAVFNANTYNNTVVIFQHGYTRSKQDGAVLANALTNLPIIAMDLPEHGQRDATPDDDSDSGAQYLTANVGQDRLNLYQSYFDMSILLKDLAAGKIDINGDLVPDTPTNIYFIGQSMGSITGSVMTSYNQANFQKVILNVGGANFAAIVDQAKNIDIGGLVNGFGVTKNTTSYLVTLGLLQLLLDPADPVNLVTTSGWEDKLMLQNAYGDTVVNNTANSILAKQLGFSEYTTVTADNYTTLDNLAQWFMFGGEEGVAANWVTHGFLLNPYVLDPETGEERYPEAAGHLSQEYVQQAYVMVNSLVNSFFNPGQ